VKRKRYLQEALFETIRPTARAVEDGQNLNVVAKPAIGNNIGRAAYDELSRPGQPARLPEVRMIAQCVDRSDEADHDSSGGDRIVARYEVSDRLELRERGARPTGPRPFAEYFPTTRATSSSLAKSPRSAAAIPASILPICQAFSAT
jgi:hypothetical protein